jgi:hypothetical protein
VVVADLAVLVVVPIRQFVDFNAHSLGRNCLIAMEETAATATATATATTAAQIHDS